MSYATQYTYILVFYSQKQLHLIFRNKQSYRNLNACFWDIIYSYMDIFYDMNIAHFSKFRIL
jgi:hypothetical protein